MQGRRDWRSQGTARLGRGLKLPNFYGAETDLVSMILQQDWPGWPLTKVWPVFVFTVGDQSPEHLAKAVVFNHFIAI